MCEFYECWQDVDVGGYLVDFVWFYFLCPSDEERDADTSFVDASFFAFHVCVEPFCLRAIVGGEDDDGVLCEVESVEGV